MNIFVFKIIFRVLLNRPKICFNAAFPNILVLFQMLSLFYTENKIISQKLPGSQLLALLMLKVSCVSFLLDNSLQEFVSRLLSNPSSFFFCDSLKLLQIRWSSGMDLNLQFIPQFLRTQVRLCTGQSVTFTLVNWRQFISRSDLCLD